MPVSTFLGLQTSLRGLLAHQQALDVTGHNISNANTQGYSRQEALLEATTPLTLPAFLGSGAGAQLGQGVDVAQFRRMRDSFLDLQYRAANMTQGQQSAMADALGGLEGVLGEDGQGGISSLLNQFWDAWQDLANHPENADTKQALLGQASKLVSAINALDQQLTTAQAAAMQQYTDLTAAGQGDVATAATEIARLNAAIKAAVAAGEAPNDLLDRRDALLDRLSELGQVSVTDLGNGSISVQFGDAAAPLVNDTTTTWPQALTNPGGKLGALLQLANVPGGTLDAYRTDLDGFVNQLVTDVNTAHGAPFFGGATAGTMTVVATAATVRASSGAAPGGNDVALAVGALRNGAADTRYADLVRRIGADAADATRQEQTATAIANTADARRASVSGVSMDEEMTNLIRFQRGYQASARAMSTFDEMLDVLINRTGKVGL